MGMVCVGFYEWHGTELPHVKSLVHFLRLAERSRQGSKHVESRPTLTKSRVCLSPVQQLCPCCVPIAKDTSTKMTLYPCCLTTTFIPTSSSLASS